MMNRVNWLFVFSGFLLFNCSRKEETLFEEQLPEETGITFQNTVTQDQDNHVLNYPYYFNGGGVAIGDINNDGLPDIYFSGNTVSNKLYLNKGDLRFEDITDKAGVGALQGWKTGVTFADVNQDGWLDLYVSRSAMSDSTLRKNLLFINNGNLTFTEKASAFGIDDDAYSTHASFFDYDKDGDLDLFILNHSLPMYAGFSNMLVNFKKQPSTKFASKLYNNDGGKFRDVSANAGIVNNVLSFGLGLAIADVNDDGWEDIYISNDFNEEDYLYINNRDGTFKNAARDAIGHMSLFSMGSDIADVNNDALPDIFTLDMLPESNERIKLSSGDDNYDKYKLLLQAGFHHQSMRNMLQLNNGDGTFAEVGQLMGISNTDWSWSALFADFDGDGWKDLYVSNGYEKDYTNMQFLKYTVDERMKSRQTGAPPNIREIIGQMPAIQVGNFLFKNGGDLRFTKTTAQWGLTRAFKSNGAAYADLDNDGDLDLVINTMNEKAVLYKNTSSENKSASYIKIDLRKANPKRIIEGTKVVIYANGKRQYQEFNPVRGFQSSMNVPLVFGIQGSTAVDSVRIIWPDGKTENARIVKAGETLSPRYEDAHESYRYSTPPKPLFTQTNTIAWTHVAADTNDFKRQLLLPKMYSYSGPRIAKGDVNGDGLEDLYMCGPRHQTGALLLQQSDGSFTDKKSTDLLGDREYQDEDALFFDADMDGDLDLYVVSGGYLFNDTDRLLQDRLYLNDGKGNFKRSIGALPEETLAGSCVVAIDVNGDKFDDLFIGSRLTPGKYPISSPSLLLINDGKGKFTNEIKSLAPSLENRGMVCDAVATDINKDGKADLVIAGEWTRVGFFLNNNNKLEDESNKWLPTSTSGWWNRLIAADLDGDGDTDLIAGNYGQNNQFNVSEEHPVTLTFKDFNQDGQVDPFLSYYINGVSYPYASRDEALGQVGTLRSRFPDYNAYSNATLDKIFTPQELENSQQLKADQLKTIMLENVGGKFEIRELPIEVQFAPIYALVCVDVDSDGDLDVIAAGNESMTRVRTGRSDANEGVLLINDGKGKFTYASQSLSGLQLKGDVRDLVLIEDKDDNVKLIVGKNGSAVQSYHLNKH